MKRRSFLRLLSAGFAGMMAGRLVKEALPLLKTTETKLKDEKPVKETIESYPNDLAGDYWYWTCADGTTNSTVTFSSCSSDTNWICPWVS